MKRSEQTTIDEAIYGLTFYLDDLENIVELIKEREYELFLSDSTYEYNDLDELTSENPKGLKNLHISAYSPKFAVDRINIFINGNRTSFFAQIMSPETRNLMLNIRHKLGSGRPYWYVTFFPSIVMFIGAIPLVLVYLRNMLSSTPPSTNYYPPAWVIWSLFTIIGYYLLARIFYKKPVVTVHRRKEERLWDRYGEQIVFMVIGAVLTIIGALIISYLTE